jgi:hypothetical protein
MYVMTTTFAYTKVQVRSKLSSRALELLEVVNLATIWEGDERPGSKLAQFYVPKLGDGSYGSGDAAAFKALERRGLIKAHPNTGAYSYEITADGIAVLQTCTRTRA